MTGSVHAHFKDKQDLFRQIVRETPGSLRSRLKGFSGTSRPGDIHCL
ncbi:MAG: hypothetical protein WDA72_06985 [Desulfomonilia bacterium]|nr:hypothetical protein [Deltaproteobacteria bacterium]HPW69947.1 hypothetical protein [Deltaproteobacteria bacterium]